MSQSPVLLLVQLITQLLYAYVHKYGLAHGTSKSAAVHTVVENDMR